MGEKQTRKNVAKLDMYLVNILRGNKNITFEVIFSSGQKSHVTYQSPKS